MKTNSATQSAIYPGLLLAGALYAVDPVALSSSSVAPICLLPADSGGPGSSMDVGIKRASAHHDGSTPSDEETGQLFAMETEPVTTAPYWTNGAGDRVSRVRHLPVAADAIHNSFSAATTSRSQHVRWPNSLICRAGSSLT